jgi:hypothetical protein
MEVGGQRHVATALPPRKRHGTHCAKGWVGLRAGLDRCEKSSPHRDSIPGTSSPYCVAIPTAVSRSTTDTKLPSHKTLFIRLAYFLHDTFLTSWFKPKGSTNLL